VRHSPHPTCTLCVSLPTPPSLFVFHSPHHHRPPGCGGRVVLNLLLALPTPLLITLSPCITLCFGSCLHPSLPLVHSSPPSPPSPGCGGRLIFDLVLALLTASPPSRAELLYPSWCVCLCCAACTCPSTGLPAAPPRLPLLPSPPSSYAPALPCAALPCPALPCPALPCPALPCPALPCHVLPARTLVASRALLLSCHDMTSFVSLCSVLVGSGFATDLRMGGHFRLALGPHCTALRPLPLPAVSPPHCRLPSLLLALTFRALPINPFPSPGLPPTQLLALTSHRAVALVHISCCDILVLITYFPAGDFSHIPRLSPRPTIFSTPLYLSTSHPTAPHSFLRIYPPFHSSS
ncbi:unnamed protein product, partial [Closterium sp. NIES-54]